MMRILVVVVSCRRNEHLWSKILNRGIENLIILCGGAECDKLEGNILYLKCSDLYEGLSEKMMCAFDFLNRSDEFASYTHFLKADDHDTDFKKESIDNISIKHKDVLNKHDYVGQALCKKCSTAKWHFGKVSKTSKWHKKEAIMPPVPYIQGGSTYILSRKCLPLLIEHRHEQENILYEDVMVAYILKKYKINPVELRYGIRWWHEPGLVGI